MQKAWSKTFLFKYSPKKNTRLNLLESRIHSKSESEKLLDAAIQRKVKARKFAKKEMDQKVWARMMAEGLMGGIVDHCEDNILIFGRIGLLFMAHARLCGWEEGRNALFLIRPDRTEANIKVIVELTGALGDRGAFDAQAFFLFPQLFAFCDDRLYRSDLRAK